MSNEMDAWPGGETWVFQGTVAEDGTGGTHVCTLTVTPGVGNEMQLLYGLIRVGNTATAQVVTANITDGTNNLVVFVNGLSTTTALAYFNLPPVGTAPAVGGNTANMQSPILVSGTEQLILSVSTTAISVTQTFAICARIKGAVPTAVLADTVGTPVLTTNTNKVF